MKSLWSHETSLNIQNGDTQIAILKSLNFSIFFSYFI